MKAGVLYCLGDSSRSSSGMKAADPHEKLRRKALQVWPTCAEDKRATATGPRPRRRLADLRRRQKSRHAKREPRPQAERARVSQAQALG
jgi:hypothetical protein